MTITLSGLEQAIKSAVIRQDKVNIVSYADDFIITGACKEVLEQKVKPIIEDFLQTRGLELSSEKTIITHIDKGFDFLGFNVRKYKGKLLIKPSKNNVKIFLGSIRNIIKKNATAKTENLIILLNPKLRGWANYYRHTVASEIFSKVDHNVFQALRQWARRRHPNKSKEWVDKKYFTSVEYDNWVFNAGLQQIPNGYYKLLTLFKLHTTPIVRHVKIKATANPFDPADAEYFRERKLRT